MKIIFGLALILMSLTTAAKSLKINEKGGVYEIQVPDKFDYHETMFNVNHVVFAPILDGIGNFTLSFTFLGIAEAKLKPQDLKNTEGDYQQGRKNFIQQHGLKLVEFRPYEFKKTSHNRGVHSAAVIYIDDEKSVTLDRTYLIECPKTLVYGKMLGDLGPEKNLEAIRKANFHDSRSLALEKITQELVCPK